jgi:hypothetical protein
MNTNGDPSTNQLPREEEKGIKRPQESQTALGPITVDWKVNVTALVAFLFSVSALFLQGLGYWKGAVVTLHPADKVLIATDGNMVRIGTRMVYTNDGATGYNALVLKELVTFSLNQHEYEQYAEARGAFDMDKTRREPVLVGSVDAAPFTIPAMQLVSHESYFAAREAHVDAQRWRYFLRRAQFIQELEGALKSGTRTVKFSFLSKTRQIAGINAGKERTLSTTCLISLDTGLLNRMKNEGWASRSCEEP